MINEYVADCAISRPLYIPGVKADVDMGGVKFSYQLGLFYTPTSSSGPLPIKLPPPVAGS